MLMLNSISRACIQQAVHAGSLYVYTTISVARTGNQFKRHKMAQVLHYSDWRFGMKSYRHQKFSPLKVSTYLYPVLIVHLFHVRDKIFVHLEAKCLFSNSKGPSQVKNWKSSFPEQDTASYPATQLPRARDNWGIPFNHQLNQIKHFSMAKFFK